MSSNPQSRKSTNSPTSLLKSNGNVKVERSPSWSSESHGWNSWTARNRNPCIPMLKIYPQSPSHCCKPASHVKRHWSSPIKNGDVVDPEADLNLEDYRDFHAYVEEKIALALQATDVKNMGGFIVQAIRENYQDPVAQAQFQERKHEEQQAMLNALKSEMSEKKSALLRQAVRTHPELLEQAAEKIQSHFARERLASYNSLQERVPRRRSGHRRDQRHPRRRILSRPSRTRCCSLWRWKGENPWSSQVASPSPSFRRLATFIDFSRRPKTCHHCGQLQKYSSNAGKVVNGIGVVTCVYVNPTLDRSWLIYYRIYDKDSDSYKRSWITSGTCSKALLKFAKSLFPQYWWILGMSANVSCSLLKVSQRPIIARWSPTALLMTRKANVPIDV